jgi:hypothetical protein
MLVAAVLRPQQREDGELEVIWPASEQVADSIELPVGETEGAVERLRLRDRAQEAIVPAGPDGVGLRSPGMVRVDAPTLGRAWLEVSRRILHDGADATWDGLPAKELASRSRARSASRSGGS